MSFQGRASLVTFTEIEARYGIGILFIEVRGSEFRF